MSPIVPLGWEAQIHRETYIAVLKGQLREPGAKKSFAARVGISPQYLSYLLNPYDHRTPSPRIARAIVDALALTQHEREHVYEHLILARGREPAVDGGHATKPGTSGAPVTGEEVARLAEEIGRLYEASLFTADPAGARLLTTQTAQVARYFLHHVDPWRHPLEYSNAAMILHEINCMRHQLSRALYYAKRARVVLSHADEAVLRPQWSRAQDALTNAMRCEAVVYNHYRLHKPALELLSQAEASVAAAASPAVWLPHLYRDRLLAVANTRRTALGEAERLAFQGTDWAERRGGDNAELLAVLLHKGLVIAYLRHNHLDQAERLARQLVDQVTKLPRAGPMHRAQVNLVYAAALWRAGRQADWQAVIAQTIQLAADAELTFALARIHHHYGAAAEPWLAQIAGEFAHKYRVSPPSSG